jgi:WhiB family transcriptional regulator, redox-sensing transcriptional regulator
VNSSWPLDSLPGQDPATPPPSFPDLRPVAPNLKPVATPVAPIYGTGRRRERGNGGESERVRLPEPVTLQGLAPPASWKLYAACRGLGPDRFFPGRGEDQTDVLSICTGCPVQIPCREYGLSAPTLLQGIWGGLNERQRRKVRSRRARPA